MSVGVPALEEQTTKTVTTTKSALEMDCVPWRLQKDSDAVMRVNLRVLTGKKRMKGDPLAGIPVNVRTTNVRGAEKQYGVKQKDRIQKRAVWKTMLVLVLVLVLVPMRTLM